MTMQGVADPANQAPVPGRPRIQAPAGWDQWGLSQRPGSLDQMTPDDILEMQNALKGLGLYTGPLNGQADDQTRSAASRFQIGFGYGDQQGGWHPDMWYSLLTANHYVSTGTPAPPEFVSVLTAIASYPALNVGGTVKIPTSNVPAPGPPPGRVGSTGTAQGNTGYGAGLSAEQAADTDAFATINQRLTAVGLGKDSPYDLTDWVVGQIQSSRSPELIMQLLEDTPQWKQRFAGNEILRAHAAANGDPIANVLTPAQYVEYENTWADLARANGIPRQMWNDSHLVATMIGGGVSMDELENRVHGAFFQVTQMGPEVLHALTSMLGTTGPDQLALALLDPERLWPELERQVNLAVAAGTGLQSGFGLDATQTGGIVDRGISREQQQQVYGQLQELRPLTEQTAGEAQAGLYDLGVADLANAGFNLDQGRTAAELEKRRQARQAQLAGGGGALTGVGQGAIGAGTAR